MDDTRHALLEHLRRFHSLIRDDKFDVGSFLSLFADVFGCETVCIFKLCLDESKRPYLHPIHWAAGTEPLQDVSLDAGDVCSQALDTGQFLPIGCEFSAVECPTGLLDQDVKRCIIGPIDVVEETLELILIGTRKDHVRLDPDDVPLAEILSYFLSLKFVEGELQREARILEAAGDHGFPLSLNHLRKFHIDFDFLRGIRRQLLRHDLARRKAENELQMFRVQNELDGRYFIRDILSRTKTFESTLDKMLRTGSHYREFDDLAGVRVILDYLSDLDTVVSFIEGNEDLRVVERENKIEQAGYAGYRGYHLTVQVVDPILEENGDYPRCEIQVRTAYQDSWSTKAHELTYKQENDVPQHLLSLVELLSDQLFTADKQSDILRETIERFRLGRDIGVARLESGKTDLL